MALDTGHTDFIFLALLLLPLLAQKDRREPKMVAVEVGHIKFIFLTPFLLWPYGSRARIQTRKWKENIYLTDPWGLQTNGQSRMHYALIAGLWKLQGPTGGTEPLRVQVTCSSFKNSPTMLFIKITYCHLEFISDQMIFELCFLYRGTQHRLLLSFLAGVGGPSLFLEKLLELLQNFFIGNGIWVTVLIIR